ncbi:ABC transporter ATP-binding protein [Brevibacillus sp. VP]|uniref:ABC transporter ATP-binding protein n=1 Tax=unclassified Brevibacillus TaxID=2684853 RepID=UPI00191C064C|nr:ABC transporter ATP-binding protein [Brevibacillus sp. VP]
MGSRSEAVDKVVDTYDSNSRALIKERLLIKGISKRIKQQTLVEPFELSMDAGEIVALCGGNGAGKSTVLRMIVGITQPSEGDITVNGMSWKENRTEYSNQIGYMPDQFNFGNGLTARETLQFYASLRKINVTRTEEVLELVGLTDVQDKRVSTFSKGMQQRLLFAQAILAKPALVVLDEPTNGLDPYWMEEFVQLVQQIKREGSSVIFSTHQLNIAELACDRAIFLQKGRIIQQGSVEYFQQKYGTLGLQGAFAEIFPFGQRVGQDKKPR